MIVDLKVYNGPLELLLKLIEKDEIDIYDIPINHITEAYIKSISHMDVGSDDMVDFILMASTLIEIKSKSMLPVKDEDVDYREDLVQSLLEYKKLKTIVDLMEDKKLEADKNFSRLREEIIIEKDTVNIDEDIHKLKDIFYSLIVEIEKPPRTKEVIAREEYKVDDYIGKLAVKLEKSRHLHVKDLAKEISNKSELIVYFLALLELVKLKDIRVKGNNEDVYIIKRKDRWQKINI